MINARPTVLLGVICTFQLDRLQIEQSVPQSPDGDTQISSLQSQSFKRSSTIFYVLFNHSSTMLTEQDL